METHTPRSSSDFEDFHFRLVLSNLGLLSALRIENPVFLVAVLHLVFTVWLKILLLLGRKIELFPSSITFPTTTHKNVVSKLRGKVRLRRGGRARGQAQAVSLARPEILDLG